MKTLLLGVTILTAAAFTLSAQSTKGSLEGCAAEAMAKHPGEFVKLEIETAVKSVEPSHPAAGTHLLELEVRGADKVEWEFTCAEVGGKIVEIEREVPSAEDALFKAKAKVTEADAQKTVLAAYPGKVTEVEYEIEANGDATYEIDVKLPSGSDEMKVEVDATSGKITEVRREHYQIGLEESAEHG